MDGCTLYAVMGSEVITVRLLVGGHSGLVTPEQAFEYFPVGEAVGAIGENDYAVTVKPKQPVKSFNRGLAITERRIGLFDLLNFGVFHDAKVFPVAGKAFEEVIPLHIAVVIGTRYIRRIQINEVNALGSQAEHVSAFDGVTTAIVEHNTVESFDLFKKMFLDGQAQIAASVIVAREVARNGKNPSWLLLETRSHESGAGKRTLLGVIKFFEVGGNAIKKPQVLRSVENSIESPLDEMGSVAPGSE
jgi:hypothetical protein